VKTIYGALGCYKCQELKKELEDAGEDFEYIDITTLDREEVRELGAKHGLALPIVVEE
jgi:arsenate reductase-like glutaredoxin family protein